MIYQIYLDESLYLRADTAIPEEGQMVKVPDPQFFAANGNYLDGPHYGKDCPVGKVQIEFVGVSPELRHSPYGWKPSDHAFLDIWIDGRRYNIQVGTFESAHGPRRGLHIVTDIHMKVDAHSMNAVDVYFDHPPNHVDVPGSPLTEHSGERQ